MPILTSVPLGPFNRLITVLLLGSKNKKFRNIKIKFRGHEIHARIEFSERIL